MKALFLLLSDPSLGKIDKFSLSQQTLMELLTQKITENRDKILRDQIDQSGLSAWKRVKFNESNEIIEISWNASALEGSIELKWLPLSLIRMNLAGNALSGTADLTCLPDTMKFLSLGVNQFEGVIDLTQLPPRMGWLNLNYNNFYGVTDFSQLPKSLAFLDVSDTELEGEILDFAGLVVTRNSNVKDKRNR